MIPTITVFSFVVAALFTTLIPVVTLIVLGIKRKISGLPLLFGAAAFFLSQIVLRIPLINILSEQNWYQSFAVQYFPYILCLSLSAGLFEESARLGGALLLKKRRSYKDVISFGLGHAFCEVIILIGLSHINNVLLCLAVNSGNGLSASMLPPETLQKAIAQLTAINPTNVYWGILERFSAVVFHIFATMLVFTGVTQKKIHYYFLAVIAHTVFNLSGVLLARFMGIAISEVILLVMALSAGFYLLKRRNNYNTEH